jgi:hypothetical protein
VVPADSVRDQQKAPVFLGLKGGGGSFGESRVPSGAQGATTGLGAKPQVSMHEAELYHASATMT